MDFIEARQIASSNMQEAIVADAMGKTQEAIRFFEIAFEAEKQAFDPTDFADSMQKKSESSKKNR